MGALDEKLTELANAIRTIISAGYKMDLDIMAIEIDAQTKAITGLIDRSGTNFTIPYGVDSIGSCAFRSSQLTDVYIPANVKSVAGNAFMDCTTLKSVTFHGTPTSISATAFSGCSNVTFTVPWVEGAVANAPWGATNATINYK